MKSPAVFLDRDGVIVKEVNYLSKPEDVEIIGSAGKAVHLINGVGIPVVIITNQAGVARGYYSEDQVLAVNDHILSELQKSGGEVTAVYYCPHHPTAGTGKYLADCSFRKPNPGMILRASNELNLDPQKSIVIGDNYSDILAGKNAGCKTILVRTGYGQKVLSNPEHQNLNPDAVCDDLISAVQLGISKGWIKT